MTCVVKLTSVLEDVEVDEDFAGAVQALNISAAKGLSFCVMDAVDGSHVAFQIPNIVSITELDD